MVVVVTGASGNIGSATLRELTTGGAYDVRALARRRPDATDGAAGTVEWAAADVGTDDLVPLLEGAEAVVHLAWRFQPTHRPEMTWHSNVVGTRRVLGACGRAGVPVVVAASSLAAYSPVEHDDPVDESWPTDGASGAAYCREKAYVERLLDDFEAEHPDTRVVRLRPAFVFQRSAASEQRRIFGGPLARPGLFDVRRIPVLPVPAGLRMQAVHTGDVGRAVRAAVERPVRGAFNLAGDGLLRRAELGELVGARTVEVPNGLVRAGLDLGWRGRALPVPGSLFDALRHVPVLSTARASRELDWHPSHDAADAVGQMLDGARLRGGSDMPPLHR